MDRLLSTVRRVLDPRIRPWLLIVAGAFLPALSIALMVLALLIDQNNLRPKELSVTPFRANPTFVVNTAPHIYLVVPDPSRPPFGQSDFPACEFRGPAGEVRVDRGDYGYWLHADHDGVYQASCEPGPLMWTTVEVYHDPEPILRHYRVNKWLEALILAGLVCLGASFFVGMSGSAHRRRQRRVDPQGVVLPKAPKDLVLVTLVGAVAPPVIMILAQVFGGYVSRRPPTIWQISGYGIGLVVGLLSAWIALHALARLADAPGPR